MAAGGWKIFTAGDVLTADDTMDYLQQGVLVFDSSGARGSAIASPVEGQFSYLKDTDSTEYYDGAAWTQVAQGGLVHIVTESFSAVSSVSLDNCFTGDYDNYRVLVRYDTSATNVLISLRFRTAGTDNSSAAYNVQSLDGYGSSVTASRSTAQTAAVILNSSGDEAYAILEVGQPFATWAAHGISSFSYGASTGNIENNSRRFGFNGTTSFDGFTIYPASGSMDGQISVYGYKK